MPPAAVLDLWRLGELRGVGYDGYDVAIGALTTWTELRHSPVVRARLPALAEAAATIGAAQIQNRGTIGGNICNASPAGDSLPVLLAVDATFDVGSVAGQRSIPAREFWTGYRQTALRPDELLLRVRFPVERGRRTRFRKVGGRAAQAISKVVMALSYREDGPTWTEVRLALGSVAATPIRARRTEAVLEGAPRERPSLTKRPRSLPTRSRPSTTYDRRPRIAAPSAVASCIACFAKRAAGRSGVFGPKARPGRSGSIDIRHHAIDQDLADRILA